MRDEILEILKGVRDDIDFETATALIDDKVLDSFDIVGIASELMEAFDIELNVENLVPDNFNTLNAIVELVSQLVNE